MEKSKTIKSKKDIDVIDCFGDMCPVPMLKIESKLKTAMPGDEFLLITDHSCTLPNIMGKYSKIVTKIEEVMLGVWQVRFKI